jgi:hypothetical protein
VVSVLPVLLFVVPRIFLRRGGRPLFRGDPLEVAAAHLFEDALFPLLFISISAIAFPFLFSE